jgi:glutamine synthetase type III
MVRRCVPGWDCVQALLGKLEASEDSLTAKSKFAQSELLRAMKTLRTHGDAIEEVASASTWKLPTYTDMLFHQD